MGNSLGVDDNCLHSICAHAFDLAIAYGAGGICITSLDGIVS